MLSPVEKKWRLLRAYTSAHPVWCAWQATYRCNFRCSFCFYWKDPMGRMPEQTVEQFAIGSRKLAKLGTLLISIAGGEPTLRDDLADIVRAVGEYHFPFLTTNGWAVTPQMADELFEAGLWGASVSLDYADARRQDKMRGKPGSFERAVSALGHLSAARRHKWQRVNVMCVLLHDNLDQVEPLLQLAADLDCYFMLQPYSALKTGAQFFRGKDRVGVAQHLLELRQRYRNFLSNPFFLSKFDKALNGGVSACKAGRAFFNIDSLGDVAICVEERAQPVANLYRHTARQIVERLRAAGEKNHCSDCWYNCRGEVESLYRPDGLIASLPTLLFDRGRPTSARPR
jgi:MoaA/NifB/PqqE/SkfB family radical SAM enzyme